MQNPFEWFDAVFFRQCKVRTNAINQITNHEGVGTEKRKIT